MERPRRRGKRGDDLDVAASLCGRALGQVEADAVQPASYAVAEVDLTLGDIDSYARRLLQIVSTQDDFRRASVQLGAPHLRVTVAPVELAAFVVEVDLVWCARAAKG